MRQEHDGVLPNRERIETACDAENCQSISGGVIDRTVGALLVELMTPLTLDVALQVQDELAARAGEADLWRAQRVQRASEEADLARQRFMQTRPENRMVADVLEAEWNAKLRALDDSRGQEPATSPVCRRLSACSLAYSLMLVQSQETVAKFAQAVYIPVGDD